MGQDLSSVFRAPKTSGPGNENQIEKYFMGPMGNTYMVLQPRDPRSHTLLPKLRDFLCTRIPENDVDPLEILKDRIDGKDPKVDLVCILCGDHLDDPGRAVLKGAGAAELYKFRSEQGQASAQLTYVVVDEKLGGGQRIAETMVFGRRHLLQTRADVLGLKLSTIFIECCNPRSLAKFKDIGVLLCLDELHRPSVEDPKVICNGHKLLVYEGRDGYPSDPEVILGAISDYWRAQGARDPEKHEKFGVMRTELSGFTGFYDTDGERIVHSAHWEKMQAFSKSFALLTAPEVRAKAAEFEAAPRVLACG